MLKNPLLNTIRNRMNDVCLIIVQRQLGFSLISRNMMAFPDRTIVACEMHVKTTVPCCNILYHCKSY